MTEPLHSREKERLGESTLPEEQNPGETLTFTVSPEAEGLRADLWLHRQRPDVSRNAFQRLCIQGLVVKDSGQSIGKNHRIRSGERLTVTLPAPTPLDVLPKNIPLDVVYEDNDLLVVNKAKGMVVHPAPGHYDDTLVNALLHHCRDSLSGINGVLRPGIVHRLDRDTSGLLIVAKNDSSHLALAAQIQAHSFLRQYEAVVYGRLKALEGIIDQPIGRHPTNRKRQCVRTDGRKAITHFRVLSALRGFTHISLRLETGRTHQIRVHMAHIGHPVAGDPVYGPNNVITGLNGQCLHAGTIGFVHPHTGDFLTFTAPPPPIFLNFLHKQHLD